MAFTEDERRDFILGYTDAMKWANTYGPAHLNTGEDHCSGCGRRILAKDDKWVGEDGSLHCGAPWAQQGEGCYPETEPFDAVGGLPLWSFDHDSMVRIEEVCDDFMRATEPMLRAASMIRPERDMSYHGHDLALTQNHHGVGFWDRGYPQALGDALTEAAHAQGSAEAFVSDEANGLLTYEGT